MDQELRRETMAEVHEFLEENFPLMRKREVLPSDMLLEQAIVDSLGLLLVVEHIEAVYGIRVGVEHMVVENFGSIAAITDFIMRHREFEPRQAAASAAVPAEQVKPAVGLG